MTTPRKMQSAALVFFALLLAGCQTSQATEAQQESVITSVEVAKKQWQNHNSGNYTFTVQHQCFCLPSAIKPRLVTVKNNKLFSIKFKDTGEVDKQPASLLLKTVDQWFTHIETITNKPKAKVATSFMAETGFPKRLSFDIHPRMADDEYSVIFSEYTPAD